MRKTFDAELLELNEALTAMARTAQDAIDVVTESLSTDDEAHAKAAIDMTASMDQMERDIENRCLQLLLRQQPRISQRFPCCSPGRGRSRCLRTSV